MGGASLRDRFPFFFVPQIRPSTDAGPGRRGREKIRLISSVVFILVLIGGAAVAPLRAEAPPRRFGNDFVRLSVNEGMSQGSGISIVQDRPGFIWIMTEDGLDRYDGRRFRVYRVTEEPASLSDVTGSVLFEDSGGILWIGTNSGLNRYNREQDDFTRYVHDPDDPKTISHDMVYSLCESRSGDLWVGTENGLNAFDPKTGTFTRYIRTSRRRVPSSPAAIRSLVEDAEGVLWMATNGGLHAFDRARGRVKRYVHDPDDPRSLSRDEVNTLFLDEDGTLWVGTNGGGLNALNPKTGTFTRYLPDFRDPRSLSHAVINVIYRDRAGRLLVGTYDGLNIFDEETKDFTVIRHDPADPDSLSSSNIISIIEDRTGVYWIGTRGRGVNKYVPDRNKFHKLQEIHGGRKELISNLIRSFAEDEAGNLYLASEDKGLEYWNRTTGAHAFIRHDPGNPSGLSDDAVYALSLDEGGALWIGTLGGGLNRYDPRTESFQHWRRDSRDPSSLSHDSIRCLLRDRAGALWVGTDGGGLNRFLPEKNAFVRYPHDPARSDSLGFDLVRAIFEDASGTLWIGLAGGGLDRFDRARETFTHFRKRPGDPGSLSNDYVMAITQDSSGALWIGTADGLNQFDPRTETFVKYGVAEGLPNAMIYALQIDEGGQIWGSTNAGLFRLNVRTGAVKSFDVSDNLQGNEFLGGSSFKTKAGEMFFGGVSGLNYFFPSDIVDNPFPPDVVLTDFQIYNKSVPIGREVEGRVVMAQAIWSTPEIELTFRDRLITFEFASLHYAAPEDNVCAYMMEGLEEDWITVKERRFASYTNLPPGRYVFRVRASNSDGLWNNDGVALRIRVIPPFWRTWWFLGLAGTAILAILGAYITTGIQRNRRRTKFLESRVRERTAELETQIAVREAAERELDKRRQYLESILLNAPNAIITVDPKGRITEWNPGAERLFGWAREEAQGKEADGLIVAKDLQGEAARLTEMTFAGTALPPRESVRLHKDGRPVPVLFGGSPIRSGGEIVGTLFVYTDITEIKKAEEAAQEANRVKSEFLANMSHEIRTPMNGVFGMTELALETDLTAEQREYLEAVQYSAASLMGILNDILDYSKIEARKIEMESIPFRLRDTIHIMIASVALLAEKKGLELAYHVAPDVPDRVKGDPGRLRQVLTNLISNAVKFTSAGEVIVTVGVEERLPDRVKLHFQVSDTGIGISPDKLRSIFAPFTQADSSATRLFGGTGLGLAITAQLVELMKGKIWAESVLDRGSTFHFIVPLDLQTQPEEETAPSRYEDLLDLPVLVVDDNAANRMILNDLLTQWGLKPAQAESGEKALDMLRERAAAGRPFRFVITDANMPRMDGFALAAAVKTMPEYADVQIMMLSSAGLRGDSAHCRKLGLTAYLTKPVKPAVLLDAILAAVGISPEKRAQAPLITRHSLGRSPARYEILLAEDNIINQKLAVRILENQGHRVTVAGNGAEALEALNRGRFDAVLMDVQMPVLDGIQATTEIRRREMATGAHIPIIAMTAHAMTGDREKCLAVGMDDYVSKPLKPLDLMKTIQRAVDRITRERRGIPREP